MSSSDVSGVAGGFRSAGAKGSIRIFDTTLRDGEQAPGASLTINEKLEVARQLARLKVDVIEAGFPAASPGDFEAVSEIASTWRRASCSAISTFSARVSAIPGACSPSRSVVSKIRTTSGSLPFAIGDSFTPAHPLLL